MNQGVCAFRVTGVWQPIGNHHQTQVYFEVLGVCLSFLLICFCFLGGFIFGFLLVPVFCIASLRTGARAEQTQSCSWTPWEEPVALTWLEQSFCSSVNHSPTARAGVCCCCGYTFTHPGFPQHRLQITKFPAWWFRHYFISCQGGTAISLAVALCSQIATPLFCLYSQSYTMQPRNFAHSAAALEALQSSVNTSSWRREPRARRDREKYALNTFGENYLNTSSVKWQTKSKI